MPLNKNYRGKKRTECMYVYKIYYVYIMKKDKQVLIAWLQMMYNQYD